jgi:hypothetical protein
VSTARDVHVAVAHGAGIRRGAFDRETVQLEQDIEAKLEREAGSGCDLLFDLIELPQRVLHLAQSAGVDVVTVPPLPAQASRGGGPGRNPASGGVRHEARHPLVLEAGVAEREALPLRAPVLLGHRPITLGLDSLDELAFHRG